MDDQTNTDDYQVTRRKALAALGAGAGTVAGVGAFSGIVAAWDRFDVCFDGCEEVSMIVSESDLTYDPPAVAKVIVSTGTGLECRTVEFTAENATTVPVQFGDSPVVKYTVPAGEKILGVLEYNYSPDPDARFDDPVWCVNANRNACATECEGDGTVEFRDDLSQADCVPADYNVCSPSSICPDGSDGTDECEDAGDIAVTWEDCETVSVTGSDDGLDEIIVYPMRCFPNGPCPDGVPGGRTIEDPNLPLTIDDRYLTVDGDEVPYTIEWIELVGDVKQNTYGKPADLNCDFIDISWEDCETVTLRGPDDNLEKIEVFLQRCFEDPGLGCPDGHIVTRENPELPLTLGRDDLATGDEEYRIDAVDLFGDVRPDNATPPDYLDCSFET